VNPLSAEAAEWCSSLEPEPDGDLEGFFCRVRGVDWFFVGRNFGRALRRNRRWARSYEAEVCALIEHEAAVDAGRAVDDAEFIERREARNVVEAVVRAALRALAALQLLWRDESPPHRPDEAPEVVGPAPFYDVSAPPLAAHAPPHQPCPCVRHGEELLIA
jgi:hypothetical protein